MTQYLMKYLMFGTLLGLCFAVSVGADEISPGIFRTPDARFEDLAGYQFEPNYMEIQGLRVHFLDEGPVDAAPILLIHGEPTWSYLFREMIPVLTAAGHRVIVPDLVGFRRSDKLASKEDYSYQLQIDAMSELVARLDLQETTFFGQDWGGMIGLRVVAAMPDRFARVVVSNTGLPSASGIRGWLGYPISRLMVWWHGPVTLEELKADTSFVRWMAHSYYEDDMDVVAIMEFFGGVTLSDEVVEAYEAPFPDGRYKAGAHVMPYYVPSQLRENEAVWQEVFEKWDKPFLVAFTDSDPITGSLRQGFIDRIPGAVDVTIEGVGHFVQEEVGPELATLINVFIAGKPVKGF